MIWFWSAAGLLVAAVLAGLLRPLIRQPRRGDESGAAIAVFRRQLADLAADAAQGRLAPGAEAAARTEITRRLLAATDGAASDAPAGPAELPWRIGAAAVIAGLLPAAAVVIYLMVGAPFAIDGSAAANQALRMHEAGEFAAAADALAARAKADPGNLENWVMLGRTLALLQRYAAARGAYARAVALAPNRPDLEAELGEVLVLAAGGVVTPAAETAFARAGNDPRARYYMAEAALQHGDRAKGASLLRALLADAPPGVPWRKLVAQRLAQIAPGTPPAGLGPTPAATDSVAAGPTRQDVAAAQAMTPAARAAMIRSMVARLAARLERHPEDKAGWARLAHAYDVLGETDNARMARARAAAADPPGVAAAAPPAAGQR
jgi:cytochrome c-type biogenesis protein CcmH